MRPAVRIVSFSKDFRHLNADGARFYVHIEQYPDLEEDFSSAVTLYLNDDFPKYVARFAKTDAAVMAEVTTATVRTVCKQTAPMFATRDADDNQWQRGTLGEIASCWLRMLGDPITATSAHDIFTNAGIFEAQVQSGFSPNSSES
jgi:hypothetical protein